MSHQSGASRISPNVSSSQRSERSLSSHLEMPHKLPHTLAGHSHTHSYGHSQSFDADWKSQEELRQRELEEARARAAQMEKTMRWWSDCTANWREKWSKARTERNKAREEVRVFRTKMEAIMKECSTMNQEKHASELEIERLRREVEVLRGEKETDKDKIFGGITSSSSPLSVHSAPERDIPLNKEDDHFATTCSPSPKPDQESDELARGTTPGSPNGATSLDINLLDKFLQCQAEKPTAANMKHSFANLDKKKSPDHSGFDDQGSIEHRLCELQVKLDEAFMTIASEREEKASILRAMEKQLQTEYKLKTKNSELPLNGDESNKLEKDQSQDDMESIKLDNEDEANSRTCIDLRVYDLRAELEELQAENAVEWGKRERIETEKLMLERDNKKLRQLIDDLHDRLDRTGGKTAECCDVRLVQRDALEKNKELAATGTVPKELADLKHAHCKLKKVLQDKTKELGHALRRAEQFELEMKKLRSRVEELKKELASAEDEVDSTTSNLRKVERSNQELQEQVETLRNQFKLLERSRVAVAGNANYRVGQNSGGPLTNEGFSEDDEAVEF